MSVFFSYTSEDKAIVEQIYVRVCEKYPEIADTLDKYEISGGIDLIETLQKASESSDKFLLFLSPYSIDKPWVNQELRKALTDEITGIKPELIIPVKMGHISQLPPFLESKFYIDIASKTEGEWLEAIYGAITQKKMSIAAPTDNLDVSIHLSSDEPNGAVVVFEPKFWAESIGFKIRTSKKIVKHFWEYSVLKNSKQVNASELSSEFEYGINLNLYNRKFQPKSTFSMTVVFEETGDPRSYVTDVSNWDGDDGLEVFEFKNFG